jgi:hypothetical protein
MTASTRVQQNDGAAHRGRQFVEHENARYQVEAGVGGRNRLRIADEEIGPRPSTQVSLRMLDVRLRKVEAYRGKTRPGLFDEVEKAPSATADVEQP